MKNKKNKKIIKLLFEIYEKGVENKECDLTTYLEKLKEAINYTHSSTQLNIGFVKGQEVLYNLFDYKILSIKYPKVYLKPLDNNNPYIETTIDMITAKNI